MISFGKSSRDDMVIAYDNWWREIYGVGDIGIEKTRHIRDVETDNCGPEPTHSSSGQSFLFQGRISSGPQRQKFQYYVTQNHSLHHSPGYRICSPPLKLNRSLDNSLQHMDPRATLINVSSKTH